LRRGAGERERTYPQHCPKKNTKTILKLKVREAVEDRQKVKLEEGASKSDGGPPVSFSGRSKKWKHNLKKGRREVKGDGKKNTRDPKSTKTGKLF